MIESNLSLVVKELQDKTLDLDTRARMARDEMMNSLIQLSKQQIKGRRPKGQKAVAGQPPMNRTGNLRRSIIGQPTRTGFANYEAIVGPTMIYGRAVEMGGIYAPNSWHNTSAIKGFPYMAPAFAEYQNKVHSQIVYKYFGGTVK